MAHCREVVARRYGMGVMVLGEVRNAQRKRFTAVATTTVAAAAAVITQI